MNQLLTSCVAIVTDLTKQINTLIYVLSNQAANAKRVIVLCRKHQTIIIHDASKVLEHAYKSH